MALAGDSLGFGIGLQAKPEDGFGILQQNVQYGRQKAAADKKRLDEENNRPIEELMKFDVKGVDPAYQPILQQEAASLVDLMKQKREQYGENSPWARDPELLKKLNNLKFLYADYKTASDRIKTHFEEMFRHPEKYDLENSQMYQTYKRDPVAWRQYLKDVQGTDIYSGGMFTPRPEDFDPEAWRKFVQIPYKSTSSTSETPEGSTYFSKKDVDLARLDAGINDYVARNPAYIQRGIAEGRWKDEADFAQQVRRAKLAEADISTESKTEKKESKDWQYGSGVAQNNRYRFVAGNRTINAYNSADPLNEQQVSEIEISAKDNEENKELLFTSPGSEKLIKGRPAKFRKYGGGEWNLVVETMVDEEIPLSEADKALGKTAETRKVSKTVEIPLDKAGTKIKSEFGNIDLDRILNLQDGQSETVAGAGTKTSSTQGSTQKVESLRKKYNY